MKFDPKRNTEDTCLHHPGVPKFHDVYKGWTCCKTRTREFTEFLNIKGCTLSKHNSVKPVEEVKKDTLGQDIQELNIKPPTPSKPIEAPEIRPCVDVERVQLPVTTTRSYNKAKANEVIKPDESDVIKVGTICKNASCKASFTGTDADNSVCVHHPGFPVFHEGMKYWSCCKRKTSDFNGFLDQVGCKRGEHLWRNVGKVTTDCRHDWHQTGNFATLSVFAKNANAETSKFEANAVSLVTTIYFGGGQRFDLSLELEGVINLSESKVTISATKVEVQLRKNRLGAWKNYATPLKNDADSAAAAAEVVQNGGEAAAVTKKPEHIAPPSVAEETTVEVDDDLSDIDDVEFD